MKRQLDNYQIKWLAAILMLIDHVGLVFFPQQFGWRMIGRWSFPLFAWLLSQGEQHTRNFQQYLLRLLLLGLISQPIYALTFNTPDLNILFTLALGIVLLRLERFWPQYCYGIWAVGAIAAQGFNFSYGAYGIGMIGLLARMQPEIIWWFLWIALHLVTIAFNQYWGLFQLPAVMTPLLLQRASHQKGRNARWFYSFYPLHLLVLALLAKFVISGTSNSTQHHIIRAIASRQRATTITQNFPKHHPKTK